MVLTAENGEDLLCQLNATKSLPDVFLLDISMPVMNGYETMTRLKHRWPDVKAIALSMYDDDFPVISMLSKGAGAFLPKDAEPEELYAAIRMVNEDGAFVNTKVAHLPRSQKELARLIPNITDRQMEFLAYCATDFSYKEIAEKMGISTRTVENYCESLFRKLEVNNRIGLAMFAIRAGLVINVEVMGS
ncbi:MAG: response regulator transcription factor [Taibaiella sp.]|nr:response regulator transcription factor [Taibaiella sp.]